MEALTMVSCRCVLTVLTLVVATGCSPSTNVEKFRAQVENWLPVETPVSQAEKTMRSKGFKVTRRIHSGSGHHILFCSRTKICLWPPADREWRVIAYFRAGEEYVFDTEAYVFLHTM
jgi:hypothetical protein